MRLITYRQTHRLLVAILGIAIFMSATTRAQQVQISFESVSVEPGEQDYFRILLDSDISISALNIPVYLPSPDITIDSVSFRYTQAHGFRLNSRLSNSNRRDFIAVVPPLNIVPEIAPPGGEICRVYFTVDEFAPNGSAPIDSFMNVITVGTTRLVEQLDASDPLGNRIVPSFQPGEITIFRPVEADSTAGEESPAGVLPTSFALKQNYPNPFNPTTRITFSVPYSSQVSLQIYDGMGRQLEQISEGSFPPGTYSRQWDATDYPSGVYIYRLVTPEGTISRKMVVIK